MIGNRRLIQGVGVNDADYQVYKCRRVEGKMIRDWTCPYYSRWVDMVKRCYSESFKQKYPTYKDCTMHEDWLYFSNFKAWMETQDWEGKQLDKDLLERGNKHYSPMHCIFIHSRINCFIRDSSNYKSKYPTGVSLSKKKYSASCCNPFTGKSDYLGVYDTPEEAHLAWRIRKRELANQLVNSEYVTDDRVRKVIIDMFK